MGGGGIHIVIYIRIGISLGLERGRKVYFRESENMAIEMSLNQGRLVHMKQHKQKRRDYINNRPVSST
jgi:hypothetical protein